jgi:8-oxo-dGTP pyrophosphatase MutT (NUDIX family)
MCPEEWRRRLAHGEGVSQAELDRIAAELAPTREKLRPGDKTEALPLFDSNGRPLGTTAPRWMCHLLALRHRCAHILLVWDSPTLGEVLVLPVRAWDKDNSPGHVDISVGGHMSAGGTGSAEETAFAEMLEETGLGPSDLQGGLVHVAGYACDERRPEEHLFNSEWRDVYVGRLGSEGLGRVHFPDGEVAGLVLVGLAETRALLAQHTLPIGSGLAQSLPRCLAHLLRSPTG